MRGVCTACGVAYAMHAPEDFAVRVQSGEVFCFRTAEREVNDLIWEGTVTDATVYSDDEYHHWTEEDAQRIGDMLTFGPPSVYISSDGDEWEVLSSEVTNFVADTEEGWGAWATAEDVELWGARPRDDPAEPTSELICREVPDGEVRGEWLLTLYDIMLAGNRPDP